MTDGHKQRKRKVRVAALDTVGHVVSELGKVYRLARRGELDLADAKSLTYVLREIRCALEAGDVERRLEALEALEAVVERQAWTPGRHGTGLGHAIN
uniref:Uncharacterized protein n=1 Tax=uncultured organism TaxID=155900 RepID=Q1EHX1_9ZZZZ|nr:hypothetical protein 10D02-34 [uncultured organism]